MLRLLAIATSVLLAELASSERTEQVGLSNTFPQIKDRAEELFDDVETMLRGQNKQLAHQILDSNQELENLVFSSKRMKKSYEGAIIEDSLDRLRGYIMNIAELTIDYSLVRQ